MMDRKKGFFFHPEDWLSDAKLSLCSYATKGAWMDIMCYMYQSKRRGYLMVDEKVLVKEDVRNMLKCRTDLEFDQIWDELIGNGVMKLHADGTYYSKRLVEDAERISLTSSASAEEMQFAQKVLEEFKRIVKNPRPYEGDSARTAIIEKKRMGATFEDFRSVIIAKFNEWNDDDKAKFWIRPKTLFGENFKKYVAESKEEESVKPAPFIEDNSHELR